MGSVLNTLPLTETDSLSSLSPNRADWLTSHADATGLAVVEVERLWNRFKQLTGSPDQTHLNPDHSALPNELSNDVFVKNLLKHFPRSKSDQSTIPFGYFIIIIQWLEASSIQDKLGAIFVYLNNGDPINATMISKLLKHIYRETKEDEIKALSNQFMQQLGSSEHGQVDRQQFITGVQRCITPGELEELLNFDIIPPHLLDEANMLPSLQSSATNIRTTNGLGTGGGGGGGGGFDLVSDEQLRQIANQSSRKNWTKLALTLGFLEYDIEAYKIKHNHDPAATMFDLLQMWREQEAGLATKSRLTRCLEESGFSELIPLLNQY